ncbi:MAG: VCBS repeat-containing protein [Sandaracinaceae bacterium]
MYASSHRTLAFACLLAALAGCDCGSAPTGGCRTSSDCDPGERCVNMACEPGVDGGPFDDAFVPPNVDAFFPGTDASYPPCGAMDRCEGDARCVEGRCVPWDDGQYDPACERNASPGPVIPQLQCSFREAPPGDPYPAAIAVLHTPLVADFGISPDPETPSRPSIVAIGNVRYQEGVPRVCDAEGFLRVLDGATCRVQGTMPATDELLNSPVTPAIGDLDGDGRPEIVAARHRGGLVAYAVAADGTITRLWTTTLADGTTDDRLGATECQWGAVSLYDLDDDGLPESFFEGGVWDHRGRRITTIPGWVHVRHGAPLTLGDYDGDGRVEVVQHNGTWEFDPATRTFAIESGYSGGAGAGYVAVADFGDFPGVAGDAPGRPEVVVSQTDLGRVGVYTLTGAPIRVFSPSPGLGGGPPTIADFDGDGAPEIGVAFGGAYEVFDVAAGDMRVWSRPSQDLSSRRTGSSVFDFNADGRAEVVYGDECFVRVYDGRDGTVLFSQARFSSTWTENPIVADVDGDGSAEMVVGMSGPCNPGYCPALDPIHEGLRCDSPDDCTSGVCMGGFCACTDASGCEVGYQCDAGRCRAAHEACVAELRVYRDGRDGWAGSRRIWNQHAYHVTNVNDDGTIPRTSEVMPNWSTPGLNNFRQNVQGTLGDGGPDLTIQSVSAVCLMDDRTRMEATMCNRGTVFLDTGIQVVFDQIIGMDRTRLCDLRTTEPVAPGVCTTVSCEADVPADGVFEATADERALVVECHEDNNTARSMADCVL